MNKILIVDFEKWLFFLPDTWPIFWWYTHNSWIGIFEEMTTKIWKINFLIFLITQILCYQQNGKTLVQRYGQNMSISFDTLRETLKNTQDVIKISLFCQRTISYHLEFHLFDYDWTTINRDLGALSIYSLQGSISDKPLVKTDG